jgi:toxin ParE1/3/4
VKIRFTNQALRQFQEALAYIKVDNPVAANQFRQQAEKILRRLEKFPESGRRIPEFPDLFYREVIIPPYRFFYRIKDKIIWVVAVCYGAQLPEAP